MTRTFVAAPALAWRSCRSSGRAGDAMRKRATNVVATRWRSTNPRSPRDLRLGVASHGSSPQNGKPGRKGPDLRIGHECLGVLQKGVVLCAGRAQFEGVHVLGARPCLVDACRPGRAGGPRRPGFMTRTSMSSVPMKPRPWRNRWLDMLKRTVPKRFGAPGVPNSGRVRNAPGSSSSTAAQRMPGVGGVERAVDRPLVGGDPRLGRGDQHQGDADDGQNRENEDRDDEGGAALAAVQVSGSLHAHPWNA